MDLLSITTIILAILGTGQQVTKGLAKLRAFCYAPVEPSGLINEISDLRAILA